MKAITSTLFAAIALLAHAAPAHALGNCKPSPNCGSPDKPCMAYITHGLTKTLITDYTAGASVIRVQACLNTSDLCVSGTFPQSVTVFGYVAGNPNAIYQKSLTVNSPDTGPYTLLPHLNRLDVRCNNVQGNCKVVWQHCKESNIAL